MIRPRLEGMSGKKEDLEQLLESAREKERNYDWASAADYYARAVARTDPNDWLEIGKTHEARACALRRFAFQAENRANFIDRMKDSLAELGEAHKSYDALGKEVSAPWRLRCSALVEYANYWLASDSGEKKIHVNESWDLAKKSLDAFDRAGEHLEFVRTLNAFSLPAQLAFCYSDECDFRESIVKDCLQYSQEAAKFAPETGVKEEISKAYSNAALFTMYTANVFTGLDKRGRLHSLAWDWLRKSLDASRETATMELCVTWQIVSFPPSFTEEESLTGARRALEMSESMRDRLALGHALEWVHFRTAARTGDSEDSDSCRTLLEESLGYSERANKEFSVINFYLPLMGVSWSGSPRAGYYAHSARLEPSLAKKREYAEKGLDAWPEELEAATASGLAFLKPGPHWDAALILTNLAKTEKDAGKKKDILERSMVHIREFIDLQVRLFPYDVWLDGAKGLLADAEYEISRIATDREERLRMMRQAISDMKENIQGLKSDPYLTSQHWESAWLADYLYQLGKWQIQLHEISGSRDDLVNAIVPLEESRAISEKMGWQNRAAEDSWQLAQVHDTLGDHSSASDCFGKAAGFYSEAAEKLPRLQSFYFEYQQYMKAWVEIEQARYHCARHQSSLSKEHYVKAAELLESTTRWRYLSSNYRAWGELENAEQLSKADSISEALDAFRRASALFDASRSSMAVAVAGIDESSEKAMTDSLIAAVEWRKSYCEGRAMLEEARLMARKEDMSASADKFDSATRVFRGISTKLKDERDLKEIQLIVTLSKAWHAMTKADAEASSKLYTEASGFFEEAKELSSFESEKLLLAGHSRFCRALAAGIEFGDTEDPALHSNATQQLESAGKYYMKAGSEDASEYANGSKLLLDAYMFMSKARKEDDLDKKAKLYALAEKVLQASVTSFEQSRHEVKRDEVVRLLGKVKRDRELAVSLGETLKAPNATSSTVAFTAPTPTFEKATGVERFEHADVQATLIAKPKELQVGQELSLDIELVNAGRGSAQLTKVEETVPEGFLVVQEPERYRMEDSKINLRGRRLDALKTEDLKLVVKPTTKGNFKLRPRIMYLDESGTYRSCEPSPIEVAVREMGISGWIRGT